MTECPAFALLTSLRTTVLVTGSVVVNVSWLVLVSVKDSERVSVTVLRIVRAAGLYRRCEELAAYETAGVTVVAK